MSNRRKLNEHDEEIFQRGLKSFGRRLHALADSVETSLATIGPALGFSNNAAYAWASANLPNLRELLRIADMFDVEPTSLVPTLAEIRGEIVVDDKTTPPEASTKLDASIAQLALVVQRLESATRRGTRDTFARDVVVGDRVRGHGRVKAIARNGRSITLVFDERVNATGDPRVAFYDVEDAIALESS